MRVLALLLGCAALPAQTPYERMLDSHRMVIDRLKEQARAITDRAAGEMESVAEWESVRDERRREMRSMLGLDPWPEKTPLEVQIAGKIERPGYVVEKIAFQSLPGVYATANLYVPADRDGPLPAVVYVCGHAYSQHGAKTAYQRHGHTLAKHGYVAMIIDPIQIAETFALHHGVLNNEMYDWYSRGYTPAGVEVWNVVRALDYLETRPEVDASRFGITGRSGGAAMSWFSAAVDERLKVVAPVMGISTYAANLEANTQRLHCDCMFPINSRLHDMLHQGALIAPRPLWMAHGRLDALFPVPGYTEFEEVVGDLYAAYGRREAFRNTVVETGHKDSDFLRAESVKWFDQWLKRIPAREIDVSFEEIPPAELSVFGGEPPDDARNYRVHEIFIPTPERQGAMDQARRDRLRTVLREKVFAATSDFEPVAAAGDRDAPDGFQALRIETEPGLAIDALYREAPEAEGPALLWIASDGEDAVAQRDTLRQVYWSKKNALMIVWPRGVGEVGWTKTLWKDAQRNAMHVGRTVDSMRLWDVRQAATVLQRKTGGPIAVAGVGTSGALGLYAGILDQGVEQAILIDPPTSHADAPIFLDVLRYTDLPEAAALMAPRRITFYGSMPEAFRPTADLAGDSVAVVMSLEGALNGRFEYDYPSGL